MTRKKRTMLYIVQRRNQFSQYEDDEAGEPERAFTSERAAEKYAAERSRELRDFTNPFTSNEPRDLLKGGERSFKKVLKEQKVPPPVKAEAEWGTDWTEWWEATRPTLTDAQFHALWDALTKFALYEVVEMPLED